MITVGTAPIVRALDHGLHDELMPQMQAVEHSESHHRGAGDLGVVGAVKERISSEVNSQ